MKFSVVLDTISDPEISDRARCAGLAAFVDALAEVDRIWLREVLTPPLYSAGVKYRLETPDVVRDIPAIRALGYADCFNLVAWRLAELRERGIEAGPLVSIESRPKQGTYKFHVVVSSERSWGRQIEDPSRHLGMESANV